MYFVRLFGFSALENRIITNVKIIAIEYGMCLRMSTTKRTYCFFYAKYRITLLKERTIIFIHSQISDYLHNRVNMWVRKGRYCTNRTLDLLSVLER